MLKVQYLDDFIRRSQIKFEKLRKVKIVYSKNHHHADVDNNIVINKFPPLEVLNLKEVEDWKLHDRYI